MNYNNDQPTAAQIKRRSTRTKPVPTWGTPTAGPSVGTWTEPPGKPGSWIRQEWRKRETLAARLLAAREREQADQRLAARLTAARIQKKSKEAKAAAVRRLLANPPARRRPTAGRTGTGSATPPQAAPEALYRTRSCHGGFTVR